MRSHIGTTLGFYLSGVDLQQLTNDLRRDGIREKNVGVVLPEIHPIAEILRDLRAARLAPDAMPQVEDALAWVMKFGVVVIPGVGLFVSGKEFAGTLFGSSFDKRSCAATLATLGISPMHAQRCEDWVASNGVVVFVASDRDEAVLAQSDMEEAGAEGVSSEMGNLPAQDPARDPMIAAHF